MASDDAGPSQRDLAVEAIAGGEDDTDSDFDSDLDGDLEADLALLKQQKASPEQKLPPVKRVTCDPYYGVKLQPRDLLLLEGKHYITDDILTFYFQYLQHEVFGKKPSVHFIKPAVAFMCLMCQANIDLKTNLEPLQLLKKDIIFFPLNDNFHTHWGLLVYVRSLDAFWYYDSLNGRCLRQARAILPRVAPYITDTSDYKFVVQPTPQQINGHDCGIYVLALCEVLTEAFYADKIETLGWVDLEDILTPERMSKMRVALKKLAESKFTWKTLE